MQVQESDLSASQNPVAANDQQVGEFKGREVAPLPSYKKDLSKKRSEQHGLLFYTAAAIGTIALSAGIGAGVATGSLSKALITIAATAGIVTAVGAASVAAVGIYLISKHGLTPPLG